jgi:hypothetical protein
MSLAQMEVFNEYFMPSIIETLGQQINMFNEASGGSIILSTEGFDGDFRQESFYKAIHSARRRVDRYAAQGTPTVTDLTQDKEIGVKVAGGFGPIRYEPSQMTWLQKPTAEGIEVASRNFAEALLQDQLNSAIAGLVAAVGNNSAVTSAAAGAMTYARVNAAHALFGDRSAEIVANVMSGAAYHQFVAQNLTNAERLFQYGAVQIVDILGKRVVVTDAPSLTIPPVVSPAAAGRHRVLGLVPNAAIVDNASDVISNIETVNGKTRIETTMQVDYSFGLRIKGYAWDVTNGGKSPSDAALATGSNWDKVATDNKHTAGVLAVGDFA